MSLKCGIIGLANTGKTTLFNCMSANKATVTRYAFSSNKSNVCIINVPDARLIQLEKLQPAQKITPATVEIVDIPGLVRGANKGEGVGNKFLSDIRSTDALIHVLRCFDDASLPHVDGSVNPVRDKETIELELQIKDLDTIDKKLSLLEKAAKSGDKEAKIYCEILQIYKSHIESCQNARTVNLNPEDKKYIHDLFLLTMKPVLYVCNVDDLSVISDNQYVEKVKESVRDENATILTIAAKLEAEISEFENSDERFEFLKLAGLSEPGVDRLIRAGYELLNLISFFTLGPKEVKAWSIRQGTNVNQAAGVIHSDMERGFIRAEVMTYDDFITFGSEAKVRETGKLHIEGKNYKVQDGDLIKIRFNI